MEAKRTRIRIGSCTCIKVGRKRGLVGGREGCRHTIRQRDRARVCGMKRGSGTMCV